MVHRKRLGTVESHQSLSNLTGKERKAETNSRYKHNGARRMEKQDSLIYQLDYLETISRRSQAVSPKIETGYPTIMTIPGLPSTVSIISWESDGISAPETGRSDVISVSVSHGDGDGGAGVANNEEES